VSKWKQGHIGRFWHMDEIKAFAYVRQPLMQSEIDEWVNMGYDHVKSYSGMMYDSRNPMPEWVNRFHNIFENYKNLTFNFYKMSTLEIMPTHTDHYNTYMRLFGAEYKNVHRILVMLEDWKPGHYLEVDGVGIINWIAGDYFIWENDCKHAAANIGVEDRYTLQITGELLSNNSTEYKLQWYNLPDRISKDESKQYYMRQFYKFIPNHIKNNPVYIYMLNQHIDELQTMTHDETAIEYLNEKGVTFYLTEPLCSYKETSQRTHTLAVYSEFVGTEDPFVLRADELDSITEYVIRNKLTNVTVYTCDYDAKKYYPYYATHLNIETDDLFIKAIPQKTVFHTDVKPIFNKKFICLNWRFTPHRQLLAAYLSLKSSIISWYYRGDLYMTADYNWFSVYKSPNEIKYCENIINGITYLNNNSPLNVDLDITEAIPIYSSKTGTIPQTKLLNNIENEVVENAYMNVFCDIVTESRFAQPTANYSEKTFHPMWYKKPFVLAAPPHTLKYLKEEGYKTFSDFWDESYDECENHKERLIKIFDVIEYIDSKTIDELRVMYEQMKPILHHNYSLIKQKLPTIEK
jgi:hypothetical protein